MTGIIVTPKAWGDLSEMYETSLPAAARPSAPASYRYGTGAEVSQLLHPFRLNRIAYPSKVGSCSSKPDVTLR